LGTVKFGRTQGVKYPHPFALPGDREILDLLALARDLGINLLDTAPAYGVSEERLGKLLGGQRQHWVIVTKAGETFEGGESHFDFSGAAIRASVERSLRRLGTDYLDAVLIHSDGRDRRILEDTDALSTLADLRAAGRIRAVGMSTKTVEGGLLAVERCDLVMVTCNPLCQEELPVIRAAHRAARGVLIKKGLLSGHLHRIGGEDPVVASLDFIFQQAGVASVVTGTIDPAHLRANAAALARVLD
jgi:aryl-alcohol dehydrogenase-like predicted oxidoreductase